MVDISFDLAKSEKNVLVRGVPYGGGICPGRRAHSRGSSKGLGERRFQALGLNGDRLHMMVFAPCANKAHVISLRKPNKRE
jgi:uncharacterized DUF497 family protein